jgi:hypothetical protein
MTEIIAAQRGRLAALDDRLARLRARYDVLMNAFKFDAARVVAAEIETAESERKLLAEALPPVPVSAPPTPYTVAHSRRRRR